jgi:hypothetical protein
LTGLYQIPVILATAFFKPEALHRRNSLQQVGPPPVKNDRRQPNQEDKQFIIKALLEVKRRVRGDSQSANGRDGIRSSQDGCKKVLLLSV